MGALGSKPKAVNAQQNQSPSQTEPDHITEVTSSGLSDADAFRNSLVPTLQALNEQVEQALKEMEEHIANNNTAEADAAFLRMQETMQLMEDKIMQEKLKQEKLMQDILKPEATGGNKSQPKRKSTTKNKKLTPKPTRSKNKK